MDANQRSEFNNQTNNGANEKWTPGSKGNTGSGPLDHTYPQGAGQGAPIRGENTMGGTGDPAHMDRQEVAAEDGARADNETTLPGAVPDDLPGGSLQSQQTGGSGPQQGITDSHQRQMEQRSGAWGLLEQPVGHRDQHSGTDLRAHPANQQGHGQDVHAMNPQNTAQPGAARPELQGTYQGRGTRAEVGYGNRQSGTGEGTGMASGPHQKEQGGKS